jgi:hypothetical protein
MQAGISAVMPKAPAGSLRCALKEAAVDDLPAGSHTGYEDLGTDGVDFTPHRVHDLFRLHAVPLREVGP